MVNRYGAASLGRTVVLKVFDVSQLAVSASAA